MSLSQSRLVLSLLFVSFSLQAFAYLYSDYESALERRAEALENRAQQLQDVAAVYRRALASGLDDKFDLTERGLFGPSVKLEFKWLGVPLDWQAVVAKKIQKEFEKDKKRLGKFAKCEVK
ncbi:hypothetical protein NMY22_g10498 [Coprinellus aureogranulatus]|nr:hypothetical protein NMY22_g10498 [Coprinellus aureogranulatus]